MLPSTRARRSAPARRDDGMTLIEVVVALGLFLVITGAVLSLLGGAIRLAKEDRYRMAATSLATRELEITRDAFTSLTRGPTTITTNQVVNPNPLPGGTANAPLVVDNVPYTVTRTAQWAQVGSTAASTCDDGSSAELAFLRVRVEVTWPGLGADRPPVSTDTVMTPPKGTYSQSTGHIGVRLLGAEGEPLAGRSVTVSGPGGTSSSLTADDGCAVFAFLPEGAYAITPNLPGHVNRDGTTSKTVQVQAGRLVRTTMEYALASRVVVAYETEPGHEPKGASGFPVTLANSALLPSGMTVVRGTVDSAGTQALTNLWPYPAGYEVWAGACTDSDPYQSDRPRALVAATPGGTSTVTLPLASVQIKVGGANPGNKAVTAKRADDATCPGGATISLGNTNSAGVLRTSVPYGRWTFTGNGRTKERTLDWSENYLAPWTL
ncbi:type IV pilus modification PilV family protein [Nocardioides ochotonae]|uniref:type IV pilus modification PilV family protein n=1 Tax=Nocardioides ochotonae TaxID=2685869 RepID=UPI002442B51A|nr:type II secretion system protein [Nocardioides ochotonae]